MTNYLELVKEFHQAFGCHISEELLMMNTITEIL